MTKTEQVRCSGFSGADANSTLDVATSREAVADTGRPRGTGEAGDHHDGSRDHRGARRAENHYGKAGGTGDNHSGSESHHGEASRAVDHRVPLGLETPWWSWCTTMTEPAKLGTMAEMEPQWWSQQNSLHGHGRTGWVFRWLRG